MDVLIVDDDRMTLALLEDYLVEWGYRAIIACDGGQAWDLLQKANAPRIVVLDWMMPRLDGPALCQALKTEDRRFTYVLMLTSRIGRSDMLVALGAGADDFLHKPVDPEELRMRLAVGVRTLRYEEALLAKEKAVRYDCYRAITMLAEARDNETGEHIKRIGVYCALIAKELGMSDEFCSDLELFAPFHDIGKVGIPDSILLAPRKLTAEEFATMKKHAALGHQILKGRPTLEMAAEIAYTHHERFNGQGYPRGIKGTNIPLCGRIAAIADVYDALRCLRPYKKAWPHVTTVEYLRTEREKHFDPDVVDAFLSLEADFAAVANRYQDLTLVEERRRMLDIQPSESGPAWCAPSSGL
jgi:putative two-component system response regulator